MLRVSGGTLHPELRIDFMCTLNACIFSESRARQVRLTASKLRDLLSDLPRPYRTSSY